MEEGDLTGAVVERCLFGAGAFVIPSGEASALVCVGCFLKGCCESRATSSLLGIGSEIKESDTLMALSLPSLWQVIEAQKNNAPPPSAEVPPIEADLKKYAPASIPWIIPWGIAAGLAEETTLSDIRKRIKERSSPWYGCELK